jgi:hypothetical protein
MSNIYNNIGLNYEDYEKYFKDNDKKRIKSFK